jgi:hypothetical protein
LALLLFLAFVFGATEVKAQDFAQRSFILPRGSFELTGTPARPEILRFNLWEGRAFRPIQVLPHFYWGVADTVTLGISHERGLCINDCDPVYDDVGFDMLIGLVGEYAYEIDLHLGVPIVSFENGTLGLRAGVLGTVNLGEHAFVFDPHFYLGLTDRGRGNRDAIVLPIWFYFQATDVVVPFVGTGIGGPFDGFGNRFWIPLEGGIVFEASTDVDLGFVLSFPNAIGRGGTLDARSIGMLARFRF